MTEQLGMNLYKLGMRPWQHSKLKLNFNNYIDKANLPSVPDQFGYVHDNDVPWGMLGNNAYGCCVLSGAAHETMVWFLGAGKPLPLFTTQNIVPQYLNLTGGDDVGLDPISTAKWRATTGLVDAAGAVHKVSRYAGLNPINFALLDLACYLFGTVGVGVQMPNVGEDEFENGIPWTRTDGTIVGGHYIPYVGKNSKGLRMFCTWGKLQAATELWLRSYCVGAVVYFSMEYLSAKGFSPSAIALSDLENDWQSLID